MHSMQAGYLEKAQKYTDKALMQLEKLKSECFCPLLFNKYPFPSKNKCVFGTTFWSLACSVGLQSYPLYLPSHSTGAYYYVPACHRPQGYGFARGTVFTQLFVRICSQLIKPFLPSGVPSHSRLVVLCLQISQVCQLCQQSPRLFTNHAAQLHTLLVSTTSKVPVALRYVKVQWLNGFVLAVLLRVSTVSQSTAWITQRHSSPQPCGWVLTDSFRTRCPLVRFSFLTHVGCCFLAHYTPGALDIHCNQPGQRLHQGRKQTPGGEFVERNKAKHNIRDVNNFPIINCRLKIQSLK